METQKSETETETVVEEPQDADLDGFTSDEDCDDMDSSLIQASTRSVMVLITTATVS